MPRKLKLLFVFSIFFIFLSYSSSIFAESEHEENTDTVIENNSTEAVIETHTVEEVIPKQSKAGDANNDGVVDDTDFSQFWLVNYLKNLMGSTFADFNNSNRVDGIDYIIWVKNFGK